MADRAKVLMSDRAANWLSTAPRREKECVLLSPKSDKAQVSPMGNVANPRQPREPSEVSQRGICVYIHGITIEIPPGAMAESLRAAARVLDRLADDTDHPPELMGS